MKTYLIITLIFIQVYFAQGQEIRLSLDQAIVTALENNKNLKIQKMNEDVASIAIKELSANLKPKVAMTADYMYFINKAVIFMPGALVGQDSEPVVDVEVGGKYAFGTSLILEQPIISEYSRRAVKGYRISESISEVRTSATIADLKVRVTAEYLQALYINEMINLNRQSLERNLRSLENSRQLLEQGKSLKVDTLSNYIAVENLKTTITHLSNHYDIKLFHLVQLLGLEAGQVIVLTDSLSLHEETSMFEEYDTDESLIANRPDIREMNLNISLMQNVYSQTKASRLPHVSLIGVQQWQAQSDDHTFNRFPGTTFVGLKASWMVFNGSKINSSAARSKIAIQQKELAFDEMMDKSRVEVRIYYNNLQEAINRLATRKSTIYAAQMNYDIISERYEHGLSSRIELADAELALTTAKISYLETIYNVRLAKLVYDHSLGLLAE